jgi:hypothetical protein
MKRINEYKKLFQIENEIDLASLKLIYRKLVKQWHPDKFQDDDPMKEEANIMGRQVTASHQKQRKLTWQNITKPSWSVALQISNIKDYFWKSRLPMARVMSISE